MGLLTPRLPDVDLEEWARRPYRERLQVMCRDWVLRGFGAPPAVYAFYVLKIGFYVGVWAYFVSRSPGAGWFDVVAFQKAILWSLVFEAMGLGAASGPLTARYFPPFGGVLYFTRPGTTRLPPYPRIPLTGGHRRSIVDVALYLALLGFTFRALLAPEVTPALVAPIVGVLPLLGLRDKTVFLAARSEHYLLTAFVFLFPEDLLAGSQAVQIALWWGAATSKLNHHFPSVITVMVCNSPLLRSHRLRRAMFRDYPDDLRPARIPTLLAHGGTALEYSFGLIFLLSDGGWVTTVALIAMVAFHTFIMTCVPLGVPVEWNVLFIYAGVFLFGVHADVSVFDIGSPVLAAVLVASLIVVPAIGNAKPEWISFLPSMRYYAGNWGTSFWLFRKDAIGKLDECLTKTAPTVQRQLAMFYDEATAQALLGKALAFRSMHLHGRALNDLVPRAVEDVEDYVINDGEWVAGVVLGWNFGDGHLHHEQLLGAVQAQCRFEPGDLRCIFVESQPIQHQHHHWRIVDAATGQVEDGHVRVRQLLASQPWPEGDGEFPTPPEREA